MGRVIGTTELLLGWEEFLSRTKGDEARHRDYESWGWLQGGSAGAARGGMRRVKASTEVVRGLKTIWCEAGGMRRVSGITEVMVG